MYLSLIVLLSFLIYFDLTKLVFIFRSYGFAGPFVYCNIVQILFFIVFEFWDESFNWTPLHDRYVMSI